MQVPKYYFHLDALVVGVVLFGLSIAGNLVLYLEYHGLVQEYSQLTIQATTDTLNLGSLEDQLAACRVRVEESASCPAPAAEQGE